MTSQPHLTISNSKHDAAFKGNLKDKPTTQPSGARHNTAGVQHQVLQVQKFRGFETPPNQIDRSPRWRLLIMSDSVGQYLNEIGAVALLTADDEKMLSKQ